MVFEAIYRLVNFHPSINQDIGIDYYEIRQGINPIRFGANVLPKLNYPSCRHDFSTYL